MKGKLLWSIFWATVAVFVIVLGTIFVGMPLHGYVLFAGLAVLFGLGVALLVLTAGAKLTKMLKAFLFLTGASAAGVLVFFILHNLISGWLGIEEPASFVMTVLVCPLAFLVGAIGNIVLFIKEPRLVREMRAVKKPWLTREVRARNFIVLGVILVAAEILVRVLIEQPAGIYTALDAVCDIAFIAGILSIIAGIFIGIFKKKW